MRDPLTEPARPGATAHAGLAAFRHLVALGIDDPLILGVLPWDRADPFAALLYRHAWAHGVAPVALDGLDDLDALLPLRTLGASVVLHLHRTDLVLGDVAPAQDPDRAVELALGALDGWIAGGGRLAWTVHDVLPPDVRHELAEARLREAIARRAALVHVLTAGTRAAAAPWYDLPPSTTVHIPRPAYSGAYPDIVERDAARDALGLDPDEHVVLLVGALRADEGLDRLRAAWDVLAAEPRPPRRLIVVGRSSADAAVGAFVAWATRHPRVIVRPDHVPADELPTYLRAADVAVVPATASLSPGSVMLALTFGLPVVAPAGGAPAEILDPATGRTFDPGASATGPGGLLEALRGAGDLVGPAARAAARAVAEAFPPGPTSHRFLDALRDRADGP